MNAAADETASAKLLDRWRASWPAALATWSRYTRLRDPRLCRSRLEAAGEGLSGSFAMIRLADQRVVVDLQQVHALALDDYAVEILAHEIGHHVLAPACATDQFRLLARIRRALPTLERHAPMVANLYTDLFINDRLQRQAGLRMADIYRRMAGTADAAAHDPLWSLYMGIYENLWQLERGSLGGANEETVHADAWLGARLVRVYAGEWLDGAGRFATLLLPYLVESEQRASALGFLHDTAQAAADCDPHGALDVEADEIDGAIHPSRDPGITGDDAMTPPAAPNTRQSRGQAREPYEYGELLRAAGITLSDHEIAVRYYRERALADLVPFPQRVTQAAPEPQMEGLEPWQTGDPLDEIDWLQSILQSPRVIPGLTTMRRVHGSVPAQERERTPVDLDIYVDSSGSMPNPQQRTSFLALAGSIIALSALRAGSRVQATLWSGKQQVTATDGFVRDEDAILRVLTGFYGGATCFPIHRLRDTYAGRKPHDRPVHILQISDDGITTMFAADERGNSGWRVAAQALARGRAGGTMALNLPRGWESMGQRGAWVADLRRARDEQGWDIHAIGAMEQLVDFARAFARKHYSGEAAT
jgi:hypothetical protein